MGESAANPPLLHAAPAACPSVLRRCIVVVAAGNPLPQPLLQGLERRGVAACLVSDAPATMVALALQPAQAVVLAPASGIASADELRQAIERYYPRTVVWEYGAWGNGAAGLTKMAPRSAAGAAPREPAAPTARSGGAPSVPAAVPERATLTPEELDMLLGRPFDQRLAEATVDPDEDDDGL